MSRKNGDEIAMAIKTIEEKIGALETARDVLRSFMVPERMAVPEARNWAAMSHREAILTVLRTAPRPLKPSRIGGLLESNGHRIAGNTLRSILSLYKKEGLVERKPTGWVYHKTE